MSLTAALLTARMSSSHTDRHAGHSSRWSAVWAASGMCNENMPVKNSSNKSSIMAGRPDNL